MTENDKIFKILIVDDTWGDVFKNIFLHSNYQLDTTTDIEQAKKNIKGYDGAIVNLRLFPQLSAEEDKASENLLSHIKAYCPFLPRIVVTGTPGNRIRSLIKELDVYNVFSKTDIHKLNIKQEINDAITECNRKVKKIFISYDKEDFKIAEQIYNDLSQPGIFPWLDNKNLLAGEKWEDKITRMIKEESDYFLVLFSQKSVSAKSFFQKEQKIASDIVDLFPENKIFIIPARIDNCEIPKRFENLKMVDLFPSYEEGFQKILKSLNS